MNVSKTKAAIICETPYQLFNALNLACNVFQADSTVDLYYRFSSEKARGYADRCEKFGVFDRIYLYEPEDKGNKAAFYGRCLLQTFLPKKYICQTVKPNPDLDKTHYDYVLIPIANELEIAFSRAFPDVEIVAYEDGLGSYEGDIFHDRQQKLVWTLLGRTTEKIRPTALYVNNAGFCNSTTTDDIRQLPGFGEYTAEYISMLENIFGFTSRGRSVYRTRRLVYLTQPLEEVDAAVTETTERIEATLGRYRDDMVVRVHPRDSADRYDDFCRDDTGCDIWELVCGSGITDEHVLISCCSTAQITPKILWDKEPYLLFTYKLYGAERLQSVQKKFASAAQRVQALYACPDRVFIPDTEEELVRVIESIRCRNNRS